MFHEVDEALRKLVTTRALGGGDVRLVFDAPTRDWAAQRNTPTVNAYLYDIREDVARREHGPVRVREENGRVTRYRQPPRLYRLSYLITAWTKRPEDEHRLLSAVLGCLLRHDTLPADMVPPGGLLATAGMSIPIFAAVPPMDPRSISDLWSALGGELKPSLDLVVVAPFPASPQIPAGPPVTELEVTVRDGGHGVSETRRKSLA
ncbi:uncharacterized protein DUF4255 [Actinomadura pelletieri DSM 43383]|uniref:Uncharacterized protein DUF4255 n=1 Tax=Actinomadura pelletieri DSM 43383 TaxID=1120940 RepID=A0A495QGU0_9ACTN|nr:DUF4255 domain-containing protein [Actinomadura pelletieri]RKS70931.1 uncharacterized protein DUF4255 [Actinomadura pelletieri DSM 43383]